MKTADYWKQRFTQLEDAQNKIGAAALPEIEAQYKRAQRQIEGKIAAWYQRFADNNGITLAEARQWLTGKDLKEFKWDVQEYIKYGQDNALMGGWGKELENASAKFHISKLEALKMHTQQSLEELFHKQGLTLSGAMGTAYKSGYYHTAYELQKGFNIGWDIAGLDQSEIEKIISKPWAADGYNFSERIWKNKEKLISEVHKELTQNIMLGADPQKAIDAIAKKMNTSRTNAGRLVMTEEAYFSSLAQKDCFLELGVEQFEIVATLDSHTSEICRNMDGQHFPMKDYEPGTTAPPFHVWCRSTTVPYFDEDFGQIGERAARDEETGKTYYIPDDMKYKDWEDTFVNGGDKSGFDVIDDGSALHYSHHKEPEPPKPKKVYLTENKLKSMIADADVQIEDLGNQFKAISGGWSYDEVIKDFGSLEDFTDGDDLTKLKDIQSQVEQIQAQKDEWTEKLNEKLIAKQKKALTKQQLDLEAQKAAIKQQLDDFEIKTYSGIWYNKDVTTADWSSLNIQGKKQYYESKFITETDPDLMQKYQDLYNQLVELDTEGKSYHDIQMQLSDIEQKIKKVQFEIDNLGKDQAAASTVFTPDAYGQRKADAWKKRFKDRYTADQYYRPLLDSQWNTLTDEEKFGVWQYTHNSNPMNRPLSGYNGRWGRQNFVGHGKVRWDNENSNYDGILNTSAFKKKFANTTNPMYGGAMRNYEDVVAETTTAIEKTAMSDDVWLRRGSDFSGLAGLLEGQTISYQEAERLLVSGDISTLQQRIIGGTFQNHAFTSTGIADGAGFGGDVSYRIYAPKGTKAIYAEPQSYFGATISGEEIYKTGKPYHSVGGEAEIIVQRGTSYRVTDIQKNGSGYEITMEIVDQPDYFKTGFEHTFDGGLTSER